MSDGSVTSQLVLVVEADPVVQRHLASLLSTLGYEPVVTGSVADSLAALGNHQFLLSLVDLDLDGADGAELLRHLKVQGGSPGAIIVIANGGSIQRMAAWKRASLGCFASVKAPRSNPKSSASSRVSGMATQSASTNGWGERELALWTARARRPLPVPVSPWMSSVGNRREATAGRGGE